MDGKFVELHVTFRLLIIADEGLRSSDRNVLKENFAGERDATVCEKMSHARRGDDHAFNIVAETNATCRFYERY